MNWFLIVKDKDKFPKFSKYTEVECKQALRIEARYQCVYCSIKEAHFGGVRNFHVEHYRPKKKFPEFENDYENLFFSCPICNSFKNDDWPADPDEQLLTCHYPDPKQIDYGKILIVDPDSRISSKNVAGRYVIERLHLNRAQLILLRKSEIVRNELTKLTDIGFNIVAGSSSKNRNDILLLLREALEVINLRIDAIPYESADTR